MPDPFLYASLANGAARGFASIFGAMDQGTALSARAKIQADLLERSAANAEQQAIDILHRGQIQAGRARAAGKQASASKKASAAAQGLDVNVGSVLDEQLGLERLGATEAETISNNAALQAFGYRSSALTDRTNAAYGNIEASAQTKSSLLSGSLEAFDRLFDSYGRYSSLKRT